MSEGGVDWIRGISYSILASIIGGASKLSIRKSWLITAELKQCVDSNPQNENENADAYDQTVTQRGNNLHNADNDRMAPLEVSTVKPTTAMKDSAEEENDNYFCFNPLRETTPIISKEKTQHSRNTLAWILYLIGMIGMTFLNPFFCVLAMKYANPSILAPFSGLTLVWVILLSGYMIGEPATRRQKVACTLIIIGQITVAVFGDHTTKSDVTVQEVIDSYKEPEFICFIIFILLVLTIMGISIYTGSSTSLLRKLSWGSIGGTVTGFQNFLKDALTISSTKPLHPIFYLFASLAMLTAFVGLLFLASCMKRFDATYSAAMFVVSFIMSATIMAAVHYHTFHDLEGLQGYIMYPLGLIILLIGASMLVQGEKPRGGESELDDNQGVRNSMCTDRLLS